MKQLRLISFSRALRAWLLRAEHLSDSEIAGFIDDDLTDEERLVVEAHLEGCSECRAATADVSRLARGYAAGPDIAVPPATRARAWNRKRLAVVATGAVAASLLLVALDRSVERRTSSPPIRASAAEPDGRPLVEVTGPAEDQTVEPDSVRLTWRSTGADLYRVSLFDDTGAPILVRETSDTIVSVGLAAGLEPGALYLWRVDAIADGTTASSGVRKFRVAR